MTLDVGGGIRLTEIRRSDRDALVELLNNLEIYRHTLRIPYPYTADDFEKWFAHLGQAAQGQGESNWAIRDASDRLIGGVGLEGLAGGPAHQAAIAHRAEIGYWLGEPWWGRGIMTAVVRTVCRHAFEDPALEKITAHIFSFNAGSARVVEKCGFELEGHLKKHFLKDGEPIDVKAYALLR